jgi:phosphoribosylanthranilate isomerase
MTRIKICGITEMQQAITAVKAGADFLGLVFAPSRRQVNEEKAAEIAAYVKRTKYHPALAGVFVNYPAPEVNRITDFCNLDWVQLSGSESWEYCLSIKRPIIKVIHISPLLSSRETIGYMKEGYGLRPKDKLIYLLDTHTEGAYGGTGQTFNWLLAKEVAATYPVIVAGGLTLDNVGQLIKEVHPWGVDVSSGVELNGKKDLEKIKEFISKVKTQELKQC